MDCVQPCGTEPGSDAKIINLLTNPSHVTRVYNVQSPWSAEALLQEIANSSNQHRFHALIDTGAMITGFSNEQVARFMLKSGIPWARAAVFLDPQDRKMAVLRTGGPAMPLDQLGMAPAERFTFFDQVHTTGMDIPQPLKARAIVMMGKGMTLRDHAQGAWRMRGLESLGQTLELWVVPEVRKMMNEAAITMGARQVGEQDSPPAAEREKLHWVMRWLISNTLDSEAMQAAQLAIQGVRSSFRSPAIQFLCASQAVVQRPSKSRDEPCFRSRFAPPYVGDAAAEWRAKRAVDDEICIAESRFAELWKGRLRLNIKDLEEQKQDEKDLKYEDVTTVQEATRRFIIAVVGMPPETSINSFASTKKREILALYILQYSDLINQENDEDDEIGDEAELFAEEQARKKLGDLHAKMQRAEEMFARFYGVDMNGPAFEGEAFGTEERRAEKRADRLKKEAEESAEGESEKQVANKEHSAKEEDRAAPSEGEIELTASAVEKDPTEVAESDAKVLEDLKAAEAVIEAEKETKKKKAEQLRAEQKREESERWHEFSAVVPKDQDLLVGCLRIFQEGLDFSVSNKIGGGESLQTSLERDVANFGSVVRALKTVSEEGGQIKNGVDTALAQIEKLTGVQSANADSSLDSEMVQEQEQEQEVEQKKDKQDFGPFHDCIIDDDTIRWSLDDLMDKAGSPAFPLEEVKFERSPLNVQLPGSIHVSPNFGARRHDAENPRRLRNLDLLLTWQSKPRPEEGSSVTTTPRQSMMIRRRPQHGEADEGSPLERSEVHYVLVTLAEAEAIMYQTDQLARCGMSLLTVDGGAVSAAELDISEQATKEPNSPSSPEDVQRARNAVFQLLRFWNSTMFYDTRSLHALLEGLESISLKDRKRAFDAMVKCRRRARRDPAETPVEAVFSYNHPSELEKHEDLIRTLRATLATAYQSEASDEQGSDELTLTQLFQRFDRDGNGELDAEELTSVLLTLNHDDIAADTVKMLGLTPKDATITSDAFVRKLEVAAEADTTNAIESDLIKRIKNELTDDFDPPPRESLTLRLKSADTKASSIDNEAVAAAHKAPPTAPAGEGARNDNQLTRAQIQVVPKHLVPKDNDAIGKMVIGAGLRASTRDNNTLMAAAGSRPTLVPTGVLLESGAWYFEVEVLQSSNVGLVSIGWVNSRWQSVHQGRPSVSEGGGVGACDASWGVSASFSKRHNGEDTPFANRSIETGDIIGCVADIRNRELSFSLNGMCVCAPVAHRPDQGKRNY